GEAALVGQHARDPCKQLAIAVLLAPGAVLLRRAEVLEGAEARHGVERAEGLAVDLPCVVQVDVETMSPAGGNLRGGHRDPHPDAAAASDEVQQAAPAAAEIEDS